ncbi:SAM-dependent methyltransferase [Pseudomonas sp. HMWF031]|nr:SAM-dependent methyltransferase [Pseudomonas sp. HMWF031]
MMTVALLSDGEFKQFQAWIHRTAGIHLSPAKKPLVAGRLYSRLKHHQLKNYSEYLRLIGGDPADPERQIAVDLVTTPETCFFREPKHFEFLRKHVLPTIRPSSTFRLWSAACSTGEEPFSLAMSLADGLNNIPWEIIASDISSLSLNKAQTACYTLTRARTIPHEAMTKYCFKGTDCQENNLQIVPSLRTRVRFMRINLNETLPEIGSFDVIFLRNVMMHFDLDTRREVVARVLQLLKPSGYFIISHSESLSGVSCALKQVAPSIYRSPA